MPQANGIDSRVIGDLPAARLTRGPGEAGIAESGAAMSLRVGNRLATPWTAVR